MHVILTAYGPFHDVRENITERVADEIGKSWDRGRAQLTVLRLPVEWRRAERILTQALDELMPDVMVSMGHAEGYAQMTVETRYFNIAEGEDNHHETRAGGVIDPGGKDSYGANIDIRGLALSLARNNIPATFHAGKEGMTYLCNFAGYVVMQHIRNRRQEKPLFVFLHLPPEALPFSVLVEGVLRVVDFLITKARA